MAKAELRMPAAEISVVAVPVDAETFIWFQAKGKEAEQPMIAALRIYAESQKQATQYNKNPDRFLIGTTELP
ncbi:MAG: hypothetical protein AAFR26_05600 [Cyanobacteria bacterium J06626_4]